ncbi:hypothetical protein M0804_001458 [Polistes exclamans]|nr:hypothetical protein M0804_001458 [Polistes exclamans]
MTATRSSFEREKLTGREEMERLEIVKEEKKKKKKAKAKAKAKAKKAKKEKEGGMHCDALPAPLQRGAAAVAAAADAAVAAVATGSEIRTKSIMYKDVQRRKTK